MNTDQKPFICLDEDGYLNTPTGRLWGTHVDDPARIRRAKRDQWMTKHSELVGRVIQITLAAMTIGLVALFIMHSQSEQQPIMSQRGSAVQKQFSALSEDDQSLIVQDWQEQQNPEPPDYPDYP